MKKIEAYRRLVEKRKTCSLCEGLCNPAAVAGGQYDSNQIGPWSLWQANLNAKLVVVGQDWGDVTYFRKWEGKDQPRGNPTDENLQKHLDIVGIKIGKPREEQDHVIFLTNLILCLKTTGGLQGRVDPRWFTNCSHTFFKPLMEVINPRAILALGRKVSESILVLYGTSYPRNAVYTEILNDAPYHLTNSTVLFPLYHCGAGSMNRNRPLPKQEEDWSKVHEWLKNSDFR